MPAADDIIADYVSRPPASLRQALARVEQGAKKAAGSLEDLAAAARRQPANPAAAPAAAAKPGQGAGPTTIEKKLTDFGSSLEGKLGEAFDKIVFQGERASTTLKAFFAEAKQMALKDLVADPLKDLYENGIRKPLQEEFKGAAKEALSFLGTTARDGLKGLGIDLDSLFADIKGIDLKAILGDGIRGFGTFFKDMIGGIGGGIGSIVSSLSGSVGSFLGNALGSLGSVNFGGVLAGIGGFLGFAEGGRPPVGRPSLVGERGPELFVPSVAGTIVPNHLLGRGGPPIVVNQSIHVSTGVAQTVRAEILGLMPRLRAEAVQAVTEARLRAAVPV